MKSCQVTFLELPTSVKRSLSVPLVRPSGEESLVSLWKCSQVYYNHCLLQFTFKRKNLIKRRSEGKVSYRYVHFVCIDKSVSKVAFFSSSQHCPFFQELKPILPVIFLPPPTCTAWGCILASALALQPPAAGWCAWALATVIGWEVPSLTSWTFLSAKKMPPAGAPIFYGWLPWDTASLSLLWTLPAQLGRQFLCHSGFAGSGSRLRRC